MCFKQKWILMKTFVESQFEIMSVYEFQTKANYYQDNCWASVWSYVSWWVSNKSDFLWTHLLSLRLKPSKVTRFEQKRILTKAFVDSQFEVMEVYEFQTKANSYEDICWVSVLSYLSLQVSNKTEFFWRHFLSLSLKLSKITCFKQNRIFMKTFFKFQFEVI